MIIYYEYEIVYIYIYIYTNSYLNQFSFYLFLFLLPSFFFFLSSFSFFSLLKHVCVVQSFSLKKILFSDFILHTHSTKGHTSSFWPCYIRYTLLIFDKFSEQFSLLMPLLHLSLETTSRFIHLKTFLNNFAFFKFFIINIR